MQDQTSYKDKYQLDHIGVHCSDCKVLDFLPFKCDLCGGTYCLDHKDYKNHKCSNWDAVEDKIVHPCPICNCLIKIDSISNLDQTMSVHMDTDCGKNKSNAPKSYKCSLKGCKTTEFVQVKCEKCKTNYCLKHRFPTSHSCPGKPITTNKNNNTETTTSTKPQQYQKRLIEDDKQYHAEQKNQKTELQLLREEQNQRYKSLEEFGEIRIIQTNGTRIQSVFAKNSTLREVQKFINSNRTDGTCSYALCTQPTGGPFKLDQLDLSISQLNLFSPITLYMLPLNNNNNTKNSSNNGKGDEGILSYLNPFRYFK